MNLGRLDDRRVTSVVAKRVINLLQSVEVSVENYRYFLIAPDGGQMLRGNRQKPATVIKTS